MVTFITSINPKNTIIQPIAIESWKRKGYNLLSVNGIHEVNSVSSTDGITIYPTDKTAMDLTGKGVPNLYPILKLAQKQEGIVCIINSDIYIPDESIFNKIVTEVKENEFWFGRRTDVDSLNILSNKWNDIYGWDWFAFNSNDVERLLEGCETFYIGEPCWDIWLPIKALQSGFRMFNVERENCYHYRHNRNWDQNRYFMYASALKWWLMNPSDKCNYTPYEDPEGLVNWSRGYIYSNSYRIV